MWSCRSYRDRTWQGMGRIQENSVNNLLATISTISNIDLRREKPNTSVIKALKLGTLQKLVLDGGDDYRRSRRGRYDRMESQNTNRSMSSPFNPFQVTFLSVASRLRTHIPKDSLNSCSIDDSFEYSPRFLVSCFISKTQNTTDTIARETTFLPSIRLLAPLLAMTFVPSNDVMFRINSNKNKYLGCLVGKKLEFDFDAILTRKDLEDINELRDMMNQALTIDGIKNPNTHPLRRALLSLCTRNRVPLKIRKEHGAFKSSDGRLLSYSDTTKNYKAEDDGFQTQNDFLPLETTTEDVIIFPPIQGVDLEEGYDYDSEEELRESMRAKIEDFESIFLDQEGDDIKREEPEVVCQQCKAPISVISTLETIKNPFTGGIAWRLRQVFGFVYGGGGNDEEYSRKLKKVCGKYRTFMLLTKF